MEYKMREVKVDLEIPEETVNSWQEILDISAQVIANTKQVNSGSD